MIKYFNSVIFQEIVNNNNGENQLNQLNQFYQPNQLNQLNQCDLLNNQPNQLIQSNQLIQPNQLSSNNIIKINNNNNSNNISWDNTMFKKFTDFTLNALKTNIKEVNKSNTNFTIFGLLFNSKKKIILSKELDGTNIIEFFTILNICEEYSTNHINNMIVFSVSFELFKYLFMYFNKLILKNESNDRIVLILKDMKSILHSYCIRIFDQCENYLQSNKNKNEIDKNIQYNLNLIEVS